MAFFTTPDGVRLHYEIEGDGAPLLLHLGSGGDASFWREAGYVEPLAQRYACILFDHRGHGLSDHFATPEANHIDRYAGDVAALVHHLGHRSVTFFGWSTGLVVGLKAAQDHPNLFDSLVLFGAVARRATPAEIAAGTASRLVGMRAKGWDFLLEDMVAAEKLPVPRWFLDRVRATDVGPWFAYTEARPAWNWSLWDAAPLVRARTLLIAGELEDPDDILAELAAAMPDAKRVRIPGREHINAFLDSADVVPLVMEFLAA